MIGAAALRTVGVNVAGNHEVHSVLQEERLVDGHEALHLFVVGQVRVAAQRGGSASDVILAHNMHRIGQAFTSVYNTGRCVTVRLRRLRRRGRDDPLRGGLESSEAVELPKVLSGFCSGFGSGSCSGSCSAASAARGGRQARTRGRREMPQPAMALRRGRRTPGLK